MLGRCGAVALAALLCVSCSKKPQPAPQQPPVPKVEAPVEPPAPPEKTEQEALVALADLVQGWKNGGIADAELRRLATAVREKPWSTAASDVISLVRRNGAKPCSELLVPFLGHEDVQIRVRAIETLAELKATEFSGEIAQRLEDEEALVRWKAVEALVAMGALDQSAAIKKRLQDENSRVRWSAKQALPALEEHEGLLRRRGTLLERSVKDPAELVKLLGSDDEVLRSLAAERLGVVGTDAHAKDLLLLLKDRDWEVRKCAIEALGLLGDEECVDRIRACSFDRDWRIREAALEALVRLGATTQKEALEKRLMVEDARVAAPVVEALGWIGEKEEVRRTSLQLLKHKDAAVRAKALEALARVGPEDDDDLGGGIRHLLKDKNEIVRVSTVIALGDLPADEKTVRELTAITGQGDPDGLLQVAARISLARIESSPKALRAILDRVQVVDGLRGLSKPLLRALNRVWEKGACAKLGREAALEQSVDSEAALREFLKQTGFSLEIGDQCRIRSRFKEGRRISPLRLLEIVAWDARVVLVLERDRVWLMEADEALRWWQNRLPAE